MSDLPDILKVTYDFTENELLRDFDHIELLPFSQDTQDWNDPQTGEFYAATFDYFAFLRARRKLDNVNFCVRVRIDHRMMNEPKREILAAYVTSQFAAAVFSLSTFAGCECVVGFHCPRHCR